MSERWILHADMDAFYASVEQRERPELRGKPVIVGGERGRGVVTAASYEARAFGVRSAMPGFRARQLCPHAVFLPGNMELYSKVSAEVRDVFFEFTPAVEPLSLDEAFLDISGSLHFFKSLEHLATALKAKVRARTQLAVSVGVGPNKLVAKLACTLSKPDGLKVVRPHEVRPLMEPLPIRRLWGIGPVTAARLEELGIYTIGGLANYDPPKLRYLLGDRAESFQARARGEDLSPVVGDGVAKSCGEENTFETDILDRTKVSSTLTAHAEAVARRLRRAGLRGRTITLKIKLGRAVGGRLSRSEAESEEPRYPLLSRSRSLDTATHDASLIRDVALSLWDRAEVREPVRLLGVSVSNLEAVSEAQQLELFTNLGKADRLGATMDEIQARFGKSAIRRAVEAPIKISPSLHKRD
jgi:DNA polymerase-4